MEKLYDVIVVGGGMGGVNAAISAVRNGARTLLLEKTTCLGGTATSGQVCEIDGGYKGDICVLPSIGREIISRLVAREAAKLYGYVPMSSNPNTGCDRIRFNPEEMKMVLEEMALEAGVNLLYTAACQAVEQTPERHIRIKLANLYQETVVEGKILVDATGNSEALYLMDQSITCKTPENKLQGVTMIYRLGNVDKEKFMENLQPEILAKIIQKGLDEKALQIRILATCPLPGMKEVSISTTRATNVDFENIESMTRGIVETHAQIRKSLAFLKKNMQGLEHCYLANVAAALGVRDRRKLIGLYELTGEEVYEAVPFDDTVAIGCYPVDIHRASGKYAVQFTDIRNGGIYSIPYRCLLSGKYGNVITGCKAICSDDTAFAAFRTMPSVMSIGNAAGLAAALAVREQEDLRSLDVKKIQAILKQVDYPETAALFA